MQKKRQQGPVLWAAGTSQDLAGEDLKIARSMVLCQEQKETIIAVPVA